MEVSVNDFAWVDAYLACGCATSYDIALFNVSVWKVVRDFPRRLKKIIIRRIL